jgi:hypothetical protein
MSEETGQENKEKEKIYDIEIIPPEAMIKIEKHAFPIKVIQCRSQESHDTKK